MELGNIRVDVLVALGKARRRALMQFGEADTASWENDKQIDTPLHLHEGPDTVERSQDFSMATLHELFSRSEDKDLNNVTYDLWLTADHLGPRVNGYQPGPLPKLRVNIVEGDFVLKKFRSI